MDENILIVDDSPDVRALFSNYLNKAGFQRVLTAHSAEEALSLLQETSIDLILTDLMMPGTNGIELCKIIRKKSGMLDIPIIVITSENEMHYLQQAFDAGALDYITKPVRKIELIARVKTALTLKHEMDQRKQREAELQRLTKRLSDANEQLHHLSSLDGLTRLANRRIFDETLEKEWFRAMRTQQPLSLMMLDVDYFKRYNDTYGHLQGDDCLKQIANILQKNIKRHADLVARYGGEEFACLLPDTRGDEAERLAEKVRQEVMRFKIPHEASNKKIVTISIGIATIIPSKKTQPEDLIQKADTALYQSKKKGRNTTSTFQEATNNMILP